MDWSTLSAWLYENDQLDVAKAHARGIGVVYVDPRSSDAVDVVAAIRAAGLVAGVYVSASWQPSSTAIEFAAYANGLLQKVVPRGTLPEAPPAMLDLEGVSSSWVVQALQAYRAHQPARPSSTTVAPFQGGLVPTAQLAAAGFHLYPQLYYGDMSPADPAGVLLELARQGFPPASLHPFYDGARLPSDARDGCAFTLERIP